MSGNKCKMQGREPCCWGWEERLTSCMVIQIFSDTAILLTYFESGGLQKRCGNESYFSCFPVGYFPHASLGFGVLKVRA